MNYTKVVKVEDLQRGQYKGVYLNDYTIEEINNTVQKYGNIAIPKTVIDIIIDVRTPNSNYGILATQKFLLNCIGVWDEISRDTYKLCEQFTRKRGLIFVAVFNALEIKSFNSYCEVIRDTMAEDMSVMAAKLSNALNLSLKTAKTAIDIVMYLNSYNGFIMEYMVSEMVSKHPNLSVLNGVEFDGDWISNSVLDKDWGIDLLVGSGEVTIPLQIKSYTHLGKSRTALEHTFTAHRDFKKKYNSFVERETKGSVYYLHYCATNLSLRIPMADFTYSLPQSRELMHRVFDTNSLDLSSIPIWEVCYILEGLVAEIKTAFCIDEDKATKYDLIQFV